MMEMNNLIDAFYRMLDLTEHFDKMGLRAHLTVLGKPNTKELFRKELLEFLLYLANCSSSLTEHQTGILNFILKADTDKEEITSFKLIEMAKAVGTPNPSKNETLALFSFVEQSSGKKGLNQQTIMLYKEFGERLMFTDENPLAQSRYDKYISELEDVWIN